MTTVAQWPTMEERKCCYCPLWNRHIYLHCDDLPYYYYYYYYFHSTLMSMIILTLSGGVPRPPPPPSHPPTHTHTHTHTSHVPLNSIHIQLLVILDKDPHNMPYMTRGPKCERLTQAFMTQCLHQSTQSCMYVYMCIDYRHEVQNGHTGQTLKSACMMPYIIPFLRRRYWRVSMTSLGTNDELLNGTPRKC